MSNTDTVHLLLGANPTYPALDNTIRVFASRERADRLLDELEAATSLGVDSDAKYRELREEYEWLPESRYTMYDVETHEMDDGC